MSWELWLKGLVGAIISSAANTITVLIADPAHFSPTANGGWKNLVTVCLVSAIVGGALYLKQSPVPQETKAGNSESGVGNEIENRQS